MNEYLKTYIDYRERVKFKRPKQFEFKYIPENLKEEIEEKYDIPVELMDENPSEQVQLEAVKQNGWNIEFIKNPSEEMQLIAVRSNGMVIQYIKNPSEEMQLIAVRKTGHAIGYIKNPSEKIQLEAVRETGNAIGYIKNPSEQVQLNAVKQNGFAIQYIENPTERIQLEAVKQTKHAFKNRFPSKRAHKSSKSFIHTGIRSTTCCLGVKTIDSIFTISIIHLALFFVG